MKAKAPRIVRSKEDLTNELKNQIALLQSSCNSYDNGLHAAGKHIALSLRVLLHHEGQSKSLLEQLNLRSGYFYDTAARINPQNLATSCNLTSIEFGPNGVMYKPLLDGPFKAKKITFAEWWNQPVVQDNKRRQFNRRDLILNVADTDGGAHVDPTLEEAYMDFSRNNSLGWTFQAGDIQHNLPGPELACMRQIAHELMLTLEKKIPDVLTFAKNNAAKAAANSFRRQEPVWMPFVKVDAKDYIPPEAPFAKIQYRLSCEDLTIPLMIRIASTHDGKLMQEVSGTSGVVEQMIIENQTFYVSVSHPAVKYEVSVLGYTVKNGDH